MFATIFTLMCLLSLTFIHLFGDTHDRSSIHDFQLVLGISMVPVILICLWFSARLCRPIQQIKDAAKQLETNDFKTPIPIHAQDELGELANIFNNLANTIQSNTHLKREIHEHQQTERALRDSEATMRVLLDAIPDLMFRIRRDGIFLDVQALPEDLLLPPDKFIGHKIGEVLPPEIAELALDRIERTFQTNENQSFEYRLTINDQNRYFEGRTAICAPNETLVIVRDITEYKQAEEAQKDAEQRVESVRRYSQRARNRHHEPGRSHGSHYPTCASFCTRGGQTEPFASPSQ